ncbi:MAG: hypothetical protein V2J10_11390, partial [Wenzhouxiangella sp.]|nr:hypothetical protein [Wenzhouxiangella sp.]
MLTFSAGDGSEVTLTIPVKETTAPVVSILGDYNCIIPACQTSLAHIINVQIDDVCEVGFDPDRLTFQLNGQELEPEEVDPINGIARYRVTLTTANDGNIIRADYTDSAGNAGSFSTPINVMQALENMPPQIIAADATLGLPECFEALDLSYSIQLIDDCEDIDPTQFSVLPADLLVANGGTLDYTVEIDPDTPTRATVRFTGSLDPGSYTLTFDYLGASKSVNILVNPIPNQAPDIVMPGNLNITLPPCQVQVPASFAIKLTDDCDPLDLERVTVTLGGTPVTPVLVDDEYVRVDVMLSAAMDGIELKATYEDTEGLMTMRAVNLNILSEPDDIAPVIIYPTLNLTYEIDPCDIGGTALVSFEVSAIDNCLGPVTPTVLINGGSQPVTTQNGVGGSTYITALAPGVYTVTITATDGQNSRTENFTITVTQDPAPLFEVACQGDLSLTLDTDCQEELTPQMLLSGELGCLDLENDLRIVVQDGNPANGPIIDGCGTFEYEIRPVIPEPVNGFAGPFDPSNWLLNTDQNTLEVGFFGDELRFANPSVPTGNSDLTARAAVLAPADGTLSFDWSFSTNESPFGAVYELFAFIIDADGEMTTVTLSNNISAGEDGTASGTVSDLDLEAGELFILSLQVDAFSPVGAQAIVSNWSFLAEPSPFLNDFIGCIGQVTTRDLSGPTVIAPDDTDVNLNNGVPLYCDQTDALNILSIPIGQRCYRTTAAGVTIPGTMVPALRAILNITGLPTVSDNCGTIEVCV